MNSQVFFVLFVIERGNTRVWLGLHKHIRIYCVMGIIHYP